MVLITTLLCRWGNGARKGKVTCLVSDRDRVQGQVGAQKIHPLTHDAFLTLRIIELLTTCQTLF